MPRNRGNRQKPKFTWDGYHGVVQTTATEAVSTSMLGTAAWDEPDRVTVYRIIGDVNISWEENGTATCTWALVYADRRPTADFTGYTQAEILSMDGVLAAGSRAMRASGVGEHVSERYTVDVKGRRELTVDSEIYLVLSTVAAAGVVRCHAGLRFLLRTD